ncbi:hypothetical protein SDC49_25855 [Lactobacillus sp. R2/2]|nr:hypothetical protein [Lactobacillus sp. R2/2]
MTHTSHKEDTDDIIKNLKIERDNFKQDYLYERKKDWKYKKNTKN